MSEDELPDDIWMQLSFDGNHYDTWCVDKINDDDVKYTRSELTNPDIDGYIEVNTALLNENAKLREALEHIRDCDRKPDVSAKRHYRNIADKALQQTKGDE